jgi:erythromycin esterase-like protein
MLRDLLGKRLEYAQWRHDGREFLSAEQNARVVRDAEQYYKMMYYGSEESWNLRDGHMFDTLARLLSEETDRTGKAKAVVWAHNSHVGDARFTSMGKQRGEYNIGQLCREAFGEKNVALMGCGTYTGTVAAAHEWDEDAQVMKVNPARPDSYEYLAHETGLERFLLDTREGRVDVDLRNELMKPRLERFIGVIYRPKTERMSHYSTAILPKQFDAYVWFEETKAVEPLEKHEPPTAQGAEETYPFGL